MNPSESAFKDVAEELRRIRPRVLVGDATAIDNAIDLLISAHNYLEEDDLDDECFDDGDEAPPVAIGDPPAYMQLFSFGDVQLFVVSVEPLTAEQQAEISHRCSFPLAWPMNPGLEIVSIEFDGSPCKPIYDGAGRLIGTAAEIIELPGLPPIRPLKGGEA